MKKVILALSAFAVLFATTAISGCANDEANAPIQGEVKTAPAGAENTTKPKPPQADVNL